MNPKAFRCLAIAALAAFLLLSAGCARAKNPVPGGSIESSASVDATAAYAPRPSTTPEAAVIAYLGIVKDAYYSLDSTLVAPYVTDDQWVREDAYIQLNQVQNQAIEMNLLEFDITSRPEVSGEASTTFVETRERWEWRYWDLKTRKPKSDWARTVYGVRYEVDRAKEGWLVAGTQVTEQSGETTPTPLP